MYLREHSLECGETGFEVIGQGLVAFQRDLSCLGKIRANTVTKDRLGWI